MCEEVASIIQSGWGISDQCIVTTFLRLLHHWLIFTQSPPKISIQMQQVKLCKMIVAKRTGATSSAVAKASNQNSKAIQDFANLFFDAMELRTLGLHRAHIFEDKSLATSDS